MKTYVLWLRIFSFGLTGLLVCTLTGATLMEKVYGSELASQYIYRSPLVIGLWGVIALSGLLYIIRCGMTRHTATFALHLSLLFILGGALITHLTGIQGRIHLRLDEAPTRLFVTSEGIRRLPFDISLQESNLIYYPGTLTPMDFVSHLNIQDATDTNVQTGTVSMNRIFRHRNYRFYQSGYDLDGRGSTLSVAYDPWGIALTYTGYALLLVSIAAFFFQRESRFRRLLRHPLLRRGMTHGALVLLVAYPVTAEGTTERKMPQTLPNETAKRFGDLYIYYNDRICPLQTVARDFTVKLCGRDSYCGLSAEQVFTGWFFYYDDWKTEPMIRIKDRRLQKRLGIDGTEACLADFIEQDGYKLDGLTENDGEGLRRNIEEANEKFNLISMLCTGSLLRIYPCHDTEGMLVWYSPADKLPAETPEKQWVFIRSSLNYVAEKVNLKEYDETEEILGKIRKYQTKEAAEVLPGETRFRAEKLYNRIGNTRMPAMLCVAVGLLAFAFGIRQILTGRTWAAAKHAGTALMFFLCAYLTLVLALRGYVSGHAPLTNGHETMTFMAWCSSLLTLVLRRHFTLAAAFGFLVCGLSLMVAMMGESNPRITLLMPVLSSPLLSLHVVVIMTAYSLLTFTMLNGLVALILRATGRGTAVQTEYLAVISRLMLYPAVFLLSAGIFIGAVWANISWGRYWGWDPKEVWALITLLVYASSLHTTSLPRFRRPLFFHVFCVAAFLTVLTTYFGVNFLLGGMHSYAGS